MCACHVEDWPQVHYYDYYHSHGHCVTQSQSLSFARQCGNSPALSTAFSRAQTLKKSPVRDVAINRNVHDRRGRNRSATGGPALLAADMSPHTVIVVGGVTACKGVQWACKCWSGRVGASRPEGSSTAIPVEDCAGAADKGLAGRALQQQ
jgi:hypothetical protein